MIRGSLSLRDVRRFLPSRFEDSHKGRYGHVLVLAGSREMPGALILCVQGALASGAGLVTMASLESLLPAAGAAVPEALQLPLKESPSRDYAPSVFRQIRARQFTVAAVGPGLSLKKGAVSLVRKAVRELVDIPLVLDADALNALARENPRSVESWFLRRKAPSVFTPHPGEMGRLLNCSTRQVQKDRIGAARRLAERLKGICVLKGSHSVVSDGTRCVLNPTGNPGMARGGMGDVLTGMIASLWAQKLAQGEPAGKSARGPRLRPGNAPDPYGEAVSPPRVLGERPASTRFWEAAWEAAQAGVYLHGLAGDIAAKEGSLRSVTVAELLRHLGRAFKRVTGD